MPIADPTHVDAQHTRSRSRSSPGQANRLGPRADTGWHKATASEYHQDVDGRLCTTYASEYICAALRRAGGWAKPWSCWILWIQCVLTIKWADNFNVIVPTSWRSSCGSKWNIWKRKVIKEIRNSMKSKRGQDEKSRVKRWWANDHWLRRSLIDQGSTKCMVAQRSIRNI